MNNKMYSQKLFSYGTLQYEKVQLDSFGRKLNGMSDTLIGYCLSEIKIQDPDVLEKSGEAVHPIIHFTGKEADCVSGCVFDISIEELQQADSYEVKEYTRTEVTLKSGIKAWAYVAQAAIKSKP